MKKVSNLYRKIPHPELPDGRWLGLMSGYEVQFSIGTSEYWFKVDSGVRGINIPVIIVIQDGNIFSVTREDINTHYE